MLLSFDKMRSLLGRLLIAVSLVGTGSAISCVKKEDRSNADQPKRVSQVQETKDSQIVNHDPEWPAAIKLAYAGLFASSSMKAFEATRKLSNMGLAAVPALERFLSQKSQPLQKRMMVSFQLADLNMFRPKDLYQLARDLEKGELKKPSIQALVRIDNEETEGMVKELIAELSGEGLEEFVGFLKKNEPRWGYSTKHLFFLDQIMQASNEMELKSALGWITDLTLEKGLIAIVKSPATKPVVAFAVAEKIVGLHGKNYKRVKEYCEISQPILLRAAAIRALLLSKIPENTKFVDHILANASDPIHALNIKK